MGISQKAIDEFKQLYKKQYGEDLSDDIASEAANRLVRFVDLIYKPIPKADEPLLRKIEAEQAQVKESDKRDFVKHLVNDAKHSEWRNLLRPYKRSEIRFKDYETITLSDGQKVNIPKVTILFKEWKGEPVKDTYGGKAVIDAGGEPLFAELAILKFLKAEFWTGVWVDSYGKKFRVGMPGVVDPVPFPEEKIALFDQIVGKVGRFAGCWDVFAWQKKEVLFVESKRKKKDKIRASQIKWLEICLSISIRPENFLFVEWDFMA
jgi:hypothetical protein